MTRNGSRQGRSQLALASASLACWLVGGSPATARVTQVNPFAGMSRFACSFSLVASAGWTVREPTAVRSAVFSLQVNEANTDEGSGSNLYFLDVRPEGTFATLTVFEKSANESKLRAVYARTHYYRSPSPDFVSMPQVEQFYGYCEPAQ